MAAFQFPDPAITQRVVHPVTNTVYEWKEPPGKWVIVVGQSANDTEAIEKLEIDVIALQNSDQVQDERLDVIESLPAPKDYIIGTDKNITRIPEVRTAPAIELVASEGFFSNVKFEGTGGLTVSSSVSSIIFDGSGIDAGGDVNLDDYYTKDEIDQQFAMRGIGYTYVLSNITSLITIRPGEFTVNNRLAGQVTLISIGPEDDDGHEARVAVAGDIINLIDVATQIEYRYTVTTVADAGVYAVEYSDSVDKRDNAFSVGHSYIINIFPTHISAADYYTKVEANSKFLNKQGGTHTVMSTVKYKGEMNDTEHLVNKGYVDSQINNGINALEQVDADISEQVDQNEEQIQAMSTALFFAQTKIENLQGLDIQNAISELSQARQDIIELKSKVNALELTSFLIME